MGLAQQTMDTSELAQNAEARERIDSAELNDMAYKIRSFVSPRSIERGDVDQLAAILITALRKSHPVSREYLIAELRAKGRSAHKAEELAGLLVRR